MNWLLHNAIADLYGPYFLAVLRDRDRDADRGLFQVGPCD